MNNYTALKQTKIIKLAVGTNITQGPRTKISKNMATGPSLDGRVEEMVDAFRDSSARTSIFSTFPHVSIF